MGSNFWKSNALQTAVYSRLYVLYVLCGVLCVFVHAHACVGVYEITSKNHKSYVCNFYWAWHLAT